MTALLLCVLVLAAVALWLLLKPSQPPASPIDMQDAWRRAQKRRAGR